MVSMCREIYEYRRVHISQAVLLPSHGGGKGEKILLKQVLF